MKKNIIIALAALMMVAVSCKKNVVQNADNESQNPVVAIEQSPDITRIIKFNKDVTARRENPELKTREVITLDEAKNNIADLFNAVYGEPTEYYGETEHAEFTITLPVDDDGNVLLDDAVAAYEEAVEMARENYHASTLENKGYICMSATVGQQRGGTAEVRLNGVFGTKTAEPAQGDDIIFGDWQYKYPMGNCEGTLSGGADSELTSAIMTKVENEMPQTPAGCRAVFTSVITLEFNGSDDRYHVFYREGDDAAQTCIANDDMVACYNGEIEAIYETAPSLNTPPFSLTQPYWQGRYYVFNVEVTGTEGTYDNGKPYITHMTEVSYGFHSYLYDTQIALQEL